MNFSRYTQFLILTLLLITVLSSCEEFFIKDLEIPRQDLDNQVVVHSFISDIDSSLYFKVARNFGLDEIADEPESLINGASIKIYEAGELLHKVVQNDSSEYQLDLDQAFGYSDETFSVEIIHPDYETAVVETEMPDFIMPESVIFTKDGGFAGPNGEEVLDLIQITFTDPVDEENYYEFQVHRVYLRTEVIFDTFTRDITYPDNYFSPDGNIDQGVSGMLLSDQIFNGQTYSLQIMLSSFEELEDIPVEKLRVSWNCISKDHYEYSKTLLKYRNSADFGLFSDPIAVYSNVENGLGVVSFRSSRILEVEEK